MVVRKKQKRRGSTDKISYHHYLRWLPALVVQAAPAESTCLAPEQFRIKVVNQQNL